MEISTSLAFARCGTEDEHLARIRAAGFTHVSPSAGTEFGRPSLYHLDEAERLRAALDRHDLKVDWLHLPFRAIAFCSPDAETRHVGMGATVYGIRIAAVMRARMAVIHPIYATLPDGCSAEDARSRLDAAYGEFLLAGRREGVGIATENLPDPPSHELNEHLLHTHPGLSLCLDTGHCELTGTWKRFLRYADRIEATHIQDTRGEDDDHLVPGDGVIDWPAVSAHLRDTGYAGVWGCEALQREDRYSEFDPAALLAEAYERMRTIACGGAPEPLLEPGAASRG